MAQPDKLTNIVLMGMGELFANYEAVKRTVKNTISPDGLNYSRRQLTLSAYGLVPKIEKLGRELPINLAVSLNAADDKTSNILDVFSHSKRAGALPLNMPLLRILTMALAMQLTWLSSSKMPWQR